MIFQTSGIRRCKIRGKKEKKGERETERGASLPDMFKHNNMTPNRPRKIGRVCAMCYYAQNKIKIFHGWSKIHTNLREKKELNYLKSEKLKDPWFPYSDVFCLPTFPIEFFGSLISTFRPKCYCWGVHCGNQGTFKINEF